MSGLLWRSNIPRRLEEEPRAWTALEQNTKYREIKSLCDDSIRCCVFVHQSPSLPQTGMERLCSMENSKNCPSEISEVKIFSCTCVY